MEKTVVVEVSRLVKHGRYGRFQKRARFLADDRVLKAQPGDAVQIEETRPLSAQEALARDRDRHEGPRRRLRHGRGSGQRA